MACRSSAAPDGRRVDGLRAAFRRRVGREADGVWAAPGRVNLIGEHTDYNDGYVLPFAIGRQALAAVAMRDDGRIRLWSRQFDADAGAHAPNVIEAGEDEIGPGRARGWTAYPLGVVWALRQAGVPVPGVDVVVDSDVPAGAGLSSSAALEGAVAVALGDDRLDRPALARVCSRAEREVVGVPTGPMDQMVSLLGRAGHALFLDCRTLAAEHVPLDLDGHDLVLLVLDTRVSHAHASGGYAERRRSCQAAAAALGLAALRDATPDAVETLGEPLRSRARHVLTEDARVLEAVARLRGGGDPTELGGLLDASHASMRDDFEISTSELNLTVETARAAGALGARMTGGGFGGAAIALVPGRAVPAVTAAVRRVFAARGWLEPHAFEVAPAEGASRVG